MPFELKVSSKAEADIASAFAWYEDKNAGLGVDFVSNVETALARIEQSPLLYAQKYGEFRQTMLPQFPYAVYFTADVNLQLISVRAILHLSQNIPHHLKPL